ncbi:MAG: glycosyltransferase [Candidatus Kapaibacterium sp.]|jgi:chlorobactene glucosyltransferase
MEILIVTSYITYIIFAVLVILLAIAMRNIFRFSKLQKQNKQSFSQLISSHGFTESPFISILVPARNEERLIQACIESLVLQEYDNFEVIVLNDNSTDKTGEILHTMSQQYSHLRIIKGKELPEGWVGKNYACHTLSLEAKGDYLLFTDADTIHNPDMLCSAMSLFLQQKLDFITLIPYEEMISWGERIIIPMIHFLYFAYLPNDIITKSRKASVSAANGQFMFFSRKGYTKIGGHEVVKNNIVEDVFLAKEVKKHGLRMALVDGTDMVFCRMYTSFSETFNGFSKNLFAGFGFDLPLFSFFLFHLFVLYILPYFLIILHTILYEQTPDIILIIGFINIAIPIIIRLTMSFRFRLSFSASFLHIVTAFFSIGIGLNSLKWTYSKRGIQWKGRNYSRQALE